MYKNVFNFLLGGNPLFSVFRNCLIWSEIDVKQRRKVSYQAEKIVKNSKNRKILIITRENFLRVAISKMDSLLDLKIFQIHVKSRLGSGNFFSIPPFSFYVILFSYQFRYKLVENSSKKN